MTDRRIFFSCLAIAFILGGYVAYLVDSYWYDEFEVSVEHPCTDTYPYLSPLLDCEEAEQKYPEVIHIGETVEHIFSEEREKKNIIQGSFFYRDLNTRRYIGVNDAKRYYPASLVKLPVAMMYYLLEASDKDLFDEKLQVTEHDLLRNEDQSISPQKRLTVGEYSVLELLRQMMIYSDNAPLRPLQERMRDVQQKIFTDLGVFIPDERDEYRGSINASVRTYANLFRILFNSSYLTLEESNDLLALLSESDYREGIARVPAGVRVAHKFGEATFTGDDMTTNHILHHCGIVYKPDEPYIICIMTEGKNMEAQQQVINRIADFVYEEQ